MYLSCHVETEPNSGATSFCLKKHKSMIAVNMTLREFMSPDSGWSCCVSQCLTLLISEMFDVLIGLFFIFHNRFGVVDPKELQEMSK